MLSGQIRRAARGALPLGYAAALVTAATLLILLGRAAAPSLNQYLFIFALPIMAAAYKWGAETGYAATLLSAVASYLLNRTSQPDQAGSFVGLVVVGGVIAFVSARLRQLERRQAVLLSEEIRRRTEDNAASSQRVARAERSEGTAIKSEQFQRVLLDTIAHDLKTPLTSILGAISILRDDAWAQNKRETQELIALAYDETQRLVRLVADVTEMSLLEGGARPRREPSDLKGIVEAAMRELRETLGRRSCRLFVSPDLPLVTGDPGLLVHVFTNILSNAAKYSPEGAPIDMRIEAENAGRIQITVADRGIGVPLTDLERIFERRYQQGPGAGTGLGLAIAKGIVDAHAGEISAMPREGGGTIVTVTLPTH